MLPGGTTILLRRLRHGSGAALLLVMSLAHAEGAQAQSLGGIEQRLQRVEQVIRGLQDRHGSAAVTAPAPDRSASVDALLQIDRRIAAVERALSGLISLQEQDHRTLTASIAQTQALKGDVESRLETVERQVATPRGQAAMPEAPVSSAPTLPVQQPPSADDRFRQAMAYAQAQDWPNAELAFDSFAATWPSDPRVPEARFGLGRALQGQGKPAQAAQIFLELYEKAPDAPFALDNLFALAKSLTDLGPDNRAQACDVYNEIEAAHGAGLTSEQRSRLLDNRLALKCAG